MAKNRRRASQPARRAPEAGRAASVQQIQMDAAAAHRAHMAGAAHPAREPGPRDWTVPAARGRAARARRRGAVRGDVIIGDAGGGAVRVARLAVGPLTAEARLARYRTANRGRPLTGAQVGRVARKAGLSPEPGPPVHRPHREPGQSRRSARRAANRARVATGQTRAAVQTRRELVEAM